MLEHQFFPSPPKVVDIMLEPWVKPDSRYDDASIVRLEVPNSPRTWDLTICDPQAGNGAILKRVRDRFKYSNDFDGRNFFACEIDYQLRTVLTAEGFRVVGTDWLQYKEPVRYTLILSNPPFEEGAAHALKNWDHIEPGGGMACLLNADTLRKPYTKDRRLLLTRLALAWGINPNDYGVSAHERVVATEDSADHSVYSLLADLESAGAIRWLGQCFRQSERPTSVEAVCIWVHLPPEEYKGPDWSQGDFEVGADMNSPEFRANPLAHRSAIKTMVAKYRRAIALIQQRAELEAELLWYLEEVEKYAHRQGDLFPSDSYQRQIRRVKSKFWQAVFDKTDLGNRIGSEDRRTFERFAIEQKNLEFNERNIVEMLQILLGNVDDMMVRLVVQVFDQMVGYHASNKQHSEGWKTNAPGKIKEDKLIFPGGVTYNPQYNIWNCDETFFADLDKALCWVSGLDYAQFSGRATLATLARHFDQCRFYGKRHDQKISSLFFEIRCFKKGTVHLWFRDPQIARDFQVAAADGRKWLAEEDGATKNS